MQDSWKIERRTMAERRFFGGRYSMGSPGFERRYNLDLYKTTTRLANKKRVS